MKSQGQENSLYNVNAVLQYAVEHDMLDVQYVQDQIEMLKREELLKKHPYKIWQGKDGKWRTYLPDKEIRKQRSKILLQSIGKKKQKILPCVSSMMSGLRIN